MTRPLAIALPVLAMLAGCSSPENDTVPNDTQTMPAGDGAMTAPGTITDPATGTVDGTQPGTMPGGEAAPMPGQTPPAVPPVNDEMGSTRGAGSTVPEQDGTPPPAN